MDSIKIKPDSYTVSVYFKKDNPNLCVYRDRCVKRIILKINPSISDYLDYLHYLSLLDEEKKIFDNLRNIIKSMDVLVEGDYEYNQHNGMKWHFGDGISVLYTETGNVCGKKISETRSNKYKPYLVGFCILCDKKLYRVGYEENPFHLKKGSDQNGV